MGTVALMSEQAKHYKELGVSFLGIGADVSLLLTAADNTLKEYKGVL